MTPNPAVATDADETEAERLLLEAAVAEARADPRSGVPHEQVRGEMLREIERLNRKIAAIAKP
jgi:plasmid stabilization system protein ParE